MPALALIIVILLAGIAGLLGTLVVERFASRAGLVQGPNERSSHVKPTARGGGAATAVVMSVVAVGLALWSAVEMWPVALAIAAIGLLGFFDDLLDLSPALRFPIQIIVVVFLVWSLHPLAPLPLWDGQAIDSWPLAVLLVFVGLWWLNLFNFMDGVDGIAASHATLVLLGAYLVWHSTQSGADNPTILVLMLASAAAIAGFLVRNWPPAKIFMGDAGSNAIAIAIFAAALLTTAQGTIGYQAWLILPAAFVADATVTLARRVARRERPWQAHRRHAYQQLARRLGHARVTTLYALITALWCIPLAMASEHFSSWSWVCVLAAYVPIIVFVIWARAGAADESPVSVMFP